MDLSVSPGEQAARQIIAEGRRVGDKLLGPKRGEIQRLCDEAEMLTNQLADLSRRGMVKNNMRVCVSSREQNCLHISWSITSICPFF